MRAERLALSPDVHQTMSADICKRLLDYCLEIKPAHDSIVMAGYATARNEVDVFPMLEEWASPKNTIHWEPYFERLTALPSVQPETRLMKFRAWSPESSLALNHFAIGEPLPDAAELRPDVILVPLLAFDRTGHRLGYGAGYYDETLRSIRENHFVLTIGVAFGFQETGQIPAESFDERLDLVITERELIDCR